MELKGQPVSSELLAELVARIHYMELKGELPDIAQRVEGQDVNPLHGVES